LQNDQDAEVRKGVVLVLGSIGSEDVVPALIQVLQDQEWRVRSNTARALETIGEGAKDAVPTLIQLLQDPEVVYRAEEALKSIGIPEALEAVKKYRSRQ